MARHLKTRILSRMDGAISHFVPNSEISASHARGVRYFVPVEAIQCFWGAMDTVQEGRRAKKHIIVRTYPLNRNVLQLYTYHFPKTWSAACVANRELIKEAQRRAHALEHDCSYAAIEWRIRFLKHYFRVCRGGAKPEPGLKPYSRFYQYTYVCIYRELKASQAAQQAAQTLSTYENPKEEDVTFNPIDHRPLRTRRTYPLQQLVSRSTASNPPPIPRWRDFCKIMT